MKCKAILSGHGAAGAEHVGTSREEDTATVLLQRAGVRFYECKYTEQYGLSRELSYSCDCNRKQPITQKLLRLI